MIGYAKPDVIKQKVYKIVKYFTGSNNYGDLAGILNNAYMNGNYSHVEELLQQFPDTDKMLADLCKKLEGKSVYTNLAKMFDNDMHPARRAKAMSSLITHTIIEVEQGNLEYRLLLSYLYNSLGTLLFDL